MKKPSQTSINIGIDAKARTRIVAILDALLADEFTLYVKARNFHWNVQGPLFSPLHSFFESQYEALDDTVDAIAERVRALDGAPSAGLKAYARLARLKDADSTGIDASGMVAALLADHEGLVRQLRKDIDTVGGLGDQGTEDFLTGLMAEHEKSAWMLRAQLR